MRQPNKELHLTDITLGTWLLEKVLNNYNIDQRVGAGP